MDVVISGPISGVCKRPGLWVIEGSKAYPLVYFQKPKWITDDDAWIRFLRGSLTAINKDGADALNDILKDGLFDNERQ